jgi:preprotein translocase subunit SecE
MFKGLWAATIEFLADVRSELKKVSFPTRGETVGSTTVVIIFCLIMSVYLSLVDSFLVWVVSKVI